MENPPVDQNANAATSSFSSPVVLELKKLDKLIERAPELKKKKKFHVKETRILEKAISSLGSKIEADLIEIELKSCRNLQKMLLLSKMVQQKTQKARASNVAISSLLSKVEADIKETELHLDRNDNDMLLLSEMRLQLTQKLYIHEAAKYKTNLQEVCEKETSMLEEEKACYSNAAISSYWSKYNAILMEMKSCSHRKLEKTLLLKKLTQERTHKEIINKVAQYKRNLEKVHERETRMLEEEKTCDSNGAVSSLGHKIKAGLKVAELQSHSNLENILIFSGMVLEVSQKFETLVAAKWRSLEKKSRETRMLEVEKVISDKM